MSKPASVPSSATAPAVVQMIPSSHHMRDHDPVHLATAMRSLVLDRQHPLALEITGTHQHRRLLIRARTQADLAHVKTQLHARLPHATFVPLTGHDDPFHLQSGETVSAVELRAGQAAYLPLQDFEQMKTGEDPILGILGALDALPSDLRAIAQIALVPAAATWSLRYQRKALEHALEPERQQDRRKQAETREEGGAPSIAFLLAAALLLAGIVFVPHFGNVLPTWVPTALQTLLHGDVQPLVSGPHHLLLDEGIGGLVLILGMPLVLKRVWVSLFQPPLYDQRTVAEKIARPAYQVCLRCYVIGPSGNTASKALTWHSLIHVARVGWTDLRSLSSLIRAHHWKQAASILRVHNPWTLLFGILKPRWQSWRVTTRERARRRQILARLIAAYRQYHQALGNYFVARRVSPRRARSFIRKGTWWKGVRRSRHLIVVQTLADLWHAPTDEALPDLAHLAYHRSRSRLLPPGLQAAQHEPSIGFSEHAGHRVPVGLPAETLRSHLLIGGKSGEGKSTFMQHLALRSMLAQGGLVVIDPHGDLVEQILCLVPEVRRDEVVLIDLSDARFACGINPLDVTMARGRDKVISDLITILSHIWAAAWGSRMEIAFEYALRTLYEANKVLCQQGRAQQQYTLLDVMTVLTDESFCHALLEQIEDLFILRWWATYYDPLSLQMQRDRIDPVLSKVAKFEGTIARHILGQSLSTIDFFECIAQEKILLVKLAKGVVGEDVARILGATLLGLLHLSLEEQGRMVAEQRKRLPILIDEFQVLDGVDWGALAELRKYGATFCLATQSLEYLREKQLLSVVLANVKQFAIFRMSAEDAELLYRELDVEPEDIVHLESLTCYLKLVAGQRQHATFSLRLHFPPDGEEEPVQEIRRRCQRCFMRPMSEVATEIAERLARQRGTGPSVQKPAQQAQTPKVGRAHQERGRRGRKGRDKQGSALPSDRSATVTDGAITKMNWEETVGTSGEEHEHDPGERV